MPNRRMDELVRIYPYHGKLLNTKINELLRIQQHGRVSKALC